MFTEKQRVEPSPVMSPEGGELVFLLSSRHRPTCTPSRTTTTRNRKKGRSQMPRVPLGVQLRAVEFDLNAERERRLALETQFEQFKSQVRSKTLEVRKEQDWCLSGVNAALEDLGLPTIPEFYDVKIQVVASQTVTVRVDTSDMEYADCTPDADGAKAYVLMDDRALDEADSGEWTIVTQTVESVEEA